MSQETIQTDDRPKFLQMGAAEINKLTVKRAKDRAMMADLVEDVVTRAGASFEREYDDQYKTIIVRITAPGGLKLNFDIDGSSSLGDDAFVLPWHMAHDSVNLLAETSFGGVVNKVHFSKATQATGSFYAALGAVKRGLDAAADGRLYQAKEEDAETQAARPRMRA